MKIGVEDSVEENSARLCLPGCQESLPDKDEEEEEKGEKEDKEYDCQQRRRVANGSLEWQVVEGVEDHGVHDS